MVTAEAAVGFSSATPSSFPPSSAKTALPPCCVLCGQRGHAVPRARRQFDGPQDLPTEKQPGQNSLIAHSERQTIAKSASCSTSKEPIALDALTRKTTSPTSALSAENLITPSLGRAGPEPPSFEDFLTAEAQSFLHYTDFSSSIIHRPPFDPAIHLHEEIFSRVIHPYNTDAFESFMTKHDLSALSAPHS